MKNPFKTLMLLFAVVSLVEECIANAVIDKATKPNFPDYYSIVGDDIPPEFASPSLDGARQYMERYIREELRGAQWWRDDAFSDYYLKLTENETAEEVIESSNTSRFLDKYRVDNIQGVFDCLAGRSSGGCYFNEPVTFVKSYTIESVKYTDEKQGFVGVSVKYTTIGYTKNDTPRTWQFYPHKPMIENVTYRLEHKTEAELDYGKAGWFMLKEVKRFISCDAMEQYYDAEIERIRLEMKEKKLVGNAEVEALLNRFLSGKGHVENICGEIH